jgi:hypothetical protein
MRKLFSLSLLLLSLPVTAKNLYIPIAGATQGQGGTFFRTDVRIFNPSPTQIIDISIHFLPENIDGTNIPGQLFRVKPREMVVLNDIVSNMVGVITPAIGALRLDSDTAFSYNFVAESRTWTLAPPAATPRGTFGQFIPALNPADARTKTAVLHLTNNQQFRTNAGAMNPGTEPATVRAALYTADGTRLLERTDVVIPPRSMRQFSILELFGGAIVNDGFVIFESTQPLFTWGSVIDNASGDPFYVPGIEDKDEVLPIF